MCPPNAGQDAWLPPGSLRRDLPAGCLPCLPPVAKAEGALPGWLLLTPSFPGAVGLAVLGTRMSVWARGHGGLWDVSDAGGLLLPGRDCS